MLTFLLTAIALSAPPSGNLDRGDVDLIGGWARDPDFAGPIPVHIYIDGHLAHDLSADALRSDLPFTDQEHGFTWRPPLLGPGSHTVVAFAIGVNSAGMPDGENQSLNNSPRTSAGECDDFPEPALSWCRGVGGYFANRHATTEYLYTRNYRVGVDTSYGGTILEFYGADHSTSLVSQHGGAAIQLSIWGYDPVGSAAWFGKGIGVCDPTPYATQASCEANNASCRRYGHSRGDHVTNCGSVQSCVEWGAGAPFNPIQAQAAGCGWLSSTNDVATVTADASSIDILHTDPFHFTQDNAMVGLDFGQTVIKHSAFVEVQYRVTYDGAYTLSSHPQEIPAVFPGDEMADVYFFYDGEVPWTNDSVTRLNDSEGGIYRIPDQPSYPHPNSEGTIAERWVTACNASRNRCMTIAMFSDALRAFSLGPASRGYGYMTPIGDFAIAPGMDEQFTLYLFPGKHNTVIDGQTVRDHIYDLADEWGFEPDVDEDTDADTDSDTELDMDTEVDVDTNGDDDTDTDDGTDADVDTDTDDDTDADVDTEPTADTDTDVDTERDTDTDADTSTPTTPAGDCGCSSLGSGSLGWAAFAWLLVLGGVRRRP